MTTPTEQPDPPVPGRVTGGGADTAYPPASDHPLRAADVFALIPQEVE